jgi:hypothetical protein
LLVDRALLVLRDMCRSNIALVIVLLGSVTACTDPSSTSSPASPASVDPPSGDPSEVPRACTIAEPCQLDVGLEPASFGVGALAIDGGRLYMSSITDGLWTTDLAGGDRTVLAANPRVEAGSIAITPTHVFLSINLGGNGRNDRLLAFPRAGGAPVWIADTPVESLRFTSHAVVAGDRVYWSAMTTHSQTAFGSVAADASKSFDWTFTEGPCASTPVDDSFLYLVDHDRILKGPRNEPRGDGTTEVLVRDGIVGLAVDKDDVFFSLVSSEIYRLPKSGGPAVKIADGGGRDLLVHDDWLFWTKPKLVGQPPSPTVRSKGTFMAVKKSGGQPIELASGLTTGAFAVDDRHFYGALEDGVVKLAYR